MRFGPQTTPRVFGMPPGAAFADGLAAGLAQMSRGHPPETMARVHVHLNTGRMLREVRAALARQGVALAPRLTRLADIGHLPWPGIAPAASALGRTLELAGLIGHLADREPALLAATAAFDLAESLAALIDEMEDEAAHPERLESPDLAADHAAHWQRSLSFLRIARRYAEADAAPCEARRFRLIAEALVARWAASPPADPVIVAGSTGSRGTTALVMAAVAQLPQGAVVLPGFDFDMAPDIWAELVADRAPGDAAHEDHPQYRHARFLAGLGMAPQAVLPWPGATGGPAARNRLVSLALSPAPATSRWIASGPGLGDLSAATAGLSLLEAPGARAEAEAIALAVRGALERGRSVAVVTPDRTIARRITAALDRWGIVPDDSAGTPLSLTPPGRLLRHLARVLAARVAAADLLVLLKHPLAASGDRDRGPHLLLTRTFEAWLRRRGPAYPDARALGRWTAKSPDDRAVWAAWVGRCLAALGGPDRRTLGDWVTALRNAAEILSRGPDGAGTALWDRAEGAEARAALDQLHRAAVLAPDFTAAGFCTVIDRHLGALESRVEAAAADPRVRIVGAVEMRGVTADLVIAAGLNEGTWPAPVPPDPWMSRPMRRMTGLRLPERSIGLSAHDFQQAMAAPEVLVTRALRTDGAETVPSRWLSRIVNLLKGLPGGDGPGALKAMQDRGQSWLAMARVLDDAPREPPAPRPAPRPPVAARPRQLPVTSVRTLLSDPYAVYARHILGLRRIDPLRAEPDARDRGEVLHRIVQRFLEQMPRDRAALTAEAEAARLIAVAERVLADEVAWPTSRRFWRARVAGFAGEFARGEIARQAAAEKVVLETAQSLHLPQADFTLTARPDRIDLRADGLVEIYDWKSGSLPSAKDLTRHEVQLSLEAAMAERGGFKSIGARRVARAVYVHLAAELDEREVVAGDPSPFDAAWDRMERLIGRYDDPATVYAARAKAVKIALASDYDHLSRLGEWAMHDPATGEDLT
jgi:ATP-dependent helicase/nuclease subunit B